MQREHLSYLELAALVDLARAAIAAEKAGLPGVFVEAGCALGGSALVMAAAKAPARPFIVYDAFERIPPPTVLDGADALKRFRVISSGRAAGLGGNPYYGYQPNLEQQVSGMFRRHHLDPADHSVSFVKGLFEDTLTGSEPVALAHLDCDWYASVMTCLERLVPRLMTGGVLVVDDYAAWSGCRKAVDTYLAGRESEFEWRFRSRLHLVRR